MRAEGSADRPGTRAERARLEQLRRWRQAAVWAPVVWLPAVIYGLLADRLGLAVTLGLAGGLFAGLARGVVGLARCPRCAVRFGSSGAAFRKVWDAAGCAACGLSLFALRRQARAAAAGRDRGVDEE